MDWRTRQPLWRNQGHLHPRNSERRGNIWQKQTHMSGHRFQQGWHWILATTHMCINQTILLPHTVKVTLVGSCFTSPAESRYAPIEVEALPVVNALNTARHFVLGCLNLIIAVDHKLLLKVSSDRNLEAIPNPWLRYLTAKHSEV